MADQVNKSPAASPHNRKVRFNSSPETYTILDSPPPKLAMIRPPRSDIGKMKGCRLNSGADFSKDGVPSGDQYQLPPAVPDAHHSPFVRPPDKEGQLPVVEEYSGPISEFEPDDQEETATAKDDTVRSFKTFAPPAKFFHRATEQQVASVPDSGYSSGPQLSGAADESPYSRPHPGEPIHLHSEVTPTGSKVFTAFSGRASAAKMQGKARSCPMTSSPREPSPEEFYREDEDTGPVQKRRRYDLAGITEKYRKSVAVDKKRIRKIDDTIDYMTETIRVLNAEKRLLTPKVAEGTHKILILTEAADILGQEPADGEESEVDWDYEGEVGREHEEEEEE